MANFKELFKTEPTTDKPSKSTEEKTVRALELAEQAVKLDDEAKKDTTWDWNTIGQEQVKQGD